MQRSDHRRHRRLTSRSSSGQRLPLVVQTQRARRRNNPLRERNQEVVDVEGMNISSSRMKFNNTVQQRCSLKRENKNEYHEY